MAESSTAGNPGPATDARNDPVVDPTHNVLGLVAAANRRQDDLRDAERLHLREVLALRAETGSRDRERGEEIADLMAKHNHEVADLRARYDKELRSSEAARINAIRTVDVDAVQRAAGVQATQAGILAAQVEASATAMRTQVAATAEAATSGLTNALEPIIKDIADLRRAQYEAQGVKGEAGVVRTDQRASTAAIIAGAAVFVSLLALVAVVVIAVVTGGGTP